MGNNGEVGLMRYCVGHITGECRDCTPDPVGNAVCPRGYRPVTIRYFTVVEPESAREVRMDSEDSSKQL